jgi:hypothetical protein
MESKIASHDASDQALELIGVPLTAVRLGLLKVHLAFTWRLKKST